LIFGPDGNNQVGTVGTVGAAAMLVGVPALLVGAGLYFFGGTEQVPVGATLVPTREGALFSLFGTY
jgi:hypothetical protein